MGLPCRSIDRIQGRGSCQVPSKVPDGARCLLRGASATLWPATHASMCLWSCFSRKQLSHRRFPSTPGSHNWRIVVSMVKFPMERTQQTCTFAITLIFAILAVIVMLLRILGRLKLGRSLDLSDYIMLGSCVCFPILLPRNAIGLESIFLTCKSGGHVGNDWSRYVWSVPFPVNFPYILFHEENFKKKVGGTRFA